MQRPSSFPPNELTFTLQPGLGSLSGQMSPVASEERRNIVIDDFSCTLTGAALFNSSDPIGDRRSFCTGQPESYTNSTPRYSFWNGSHRSI